MTTDLLGILRRNRQKEAIRSLDLKNEQHHLDKLGAIYTFLRKSDLDLAQVPYKGIDNVILYPGRDQVDMKGAVHYTRGKGITGKF